MPTASARLPRRAWLFSAICSAACSQARAARARRARVLVALACALAPLAFSAGAARGAESAPAPRVVRLHGHSFTLPAGFAIDLVAAAPLVERPIVADFDEEGRLYVADSSGSNDKVAVQLETRPHRVVRLEDLDGDGVFDKSVVFADKLMFPEGAMWLEGSLYVAAPPQIWKLTDANGDGVADRREVWFDGKTLTGCANDLHGPHRGPDGFVYWCKGAWAEQTHTLARGNTATTRAAHLFRATPRGERLEWVMAGGMDNPVDVAFTAGWERVFTTTFLRHPGGGQRDGLMHAVYGGVYGKDHGPIRDPLHKWTSPELLPPLSHLGPAAPCGLHALESAAWGSEYQHNLFACQFNLRKVSRHALASAGGGLVSTDFDFVVSDHHDFHPTDVLETAGGDLLVIDTGGWYKLCCPSSQLQKADVLGAIYRVRKVDARPVADPWGRQIAWRECSSDALADLLGDPRPMARRRAVEALAQRGEDAWRALRPLLENPRSDPDACRAALGAACRLLAAGGPGDGPPDSLLAAARHEDENVRQAALHALSLFAYAWKRPEAARAALERALAEPSRANRRVAAEALGRVGDPASAPALLQALVEGPGEGAREGQVAREDQGDGLDRFLEHSLTYALIEIGAQHPEALQNALARDARARHPQARRALWIALDQLGKPPPAGEVAAAFEHPDAGLSAAARWLASRHPEWAGEVTAFFDARLKTVAAEDADALVALLTPFAGRVELHEPLARAARRPAERPWAARVALRALARSGLKEAPAAWADTLLALVAFAATAPASTIPGATVPAATDTPSDLTLLTLETLRAVALPADRQPELRRHLLALAQGDAPAETRLAALAALPGGWREASPEQWAWLLSRLAKEEPAAIRAMAVETLARGPLDKPRLLALAGALPRCGPLELPRLLDAFANSTDEEIGLRLVETLGRRELRPLVAPDAVRQRLVKQNDVVKQAAEKLYALLDAGRDERRSRLESLLAELPPGDARRGQAVFNGAKASCLACHAIGYVGGKTGPDLTRVGQIRDERDLLEAIVFPSASFVRGYEPLLVETASGRVFQGVVKEDGPRELVLTVAANQDVRLPRDTIEHVGPGKVSVMPAGLDQQLSPQELADLAAFLRACR